MITARKIKQDLMKDSEFRKEFERLRPEFERADRQIAVRAFWHWLRACLEVNYEESYWDTVRANELFYCWIQAVSQHNDAVRKSGKPHD